MEVSANGAPHAPSYGKWVEPEEGSSQQSHILHQKGVGGGIKQERREAEPLADKLLYLTNQACQSKVKSKSQLTQTMKNS